jgi:hypothetical protein
MRINEGFFLSLGAVYCYQVTVQVERSKYRADASRGGTV